MPTIRVLQTTAASPNGVQVHVYQAGETYEMPDSLAAVFLREGWGVNADAPQEEETPPDPTPVRAGRKKASDGNG